MAFNIFDPSSHKPSKPKPPKKAPPPPPPPPSRPAAVPREGGIPARSAPKIPKAIIPTDIKEIFSKIKEMKSEIDDKIQFILGQKGHTAESIKRYLNNPQNFTPTEWMMMQTHRGDLEQKLGSLITPQLKTLQTKQQAAEQGKNRKGKTLGSRKKWLPMN